jgi:hypothetical protein
MQSFLRTVRDRAVGIFERERPFFTPGAMSMYVLALVAEAPVIIARYLLALLIVFAVLVIEGNIHGGTEWALVALLPTAWSAVALFNPTGGAWWWQTRAGGREPSKREQLVYQDAVELLQANSEKPLPLPAHWFVIDSPQPDAAVCGDALMVSRVGPVLARAGVQGRPVRREPRSGGGARGLPRSPRADPRQPDPVPMAHRAHPPGHGAEDRPAPTTAGCDQRRWRGPRQCVAPGPEPCSP